MPRHGGGELRERITVQKNTPVSDTQGGRSRNVWADYVVRIPAEYVGLTGQELLQVQTVGTHLTCMFRIRTRPTVTAQMRVIWTPSWDADMPEQVFEIHAVRPWEQDLTRYLMLDCGDIV